MDIQKSLSHISPTNLKRELDVVNILLSKATYPPLESKTIPLNNFEGKHFRDFTQKELGQVIEGIANKFKGLKLVNSYSKYPDGLVFNLTDCVDRLEKYKSAIEKELWKVEYSKNNRPSYFDDEGTTFYLKLIDGTFKPLGFSSERGKPIMFSLFKVLFRQYMANPGEYITSLEVCRALETFGMKDKSNDFVKNNIANLRKKIRSAQMLGYMQISNCPNKGYRLDIKQY